MMLLLFYTLFVNHREESSEHLLLVFQFFRFFSVPETCFFDFFVTQRFLNKHITTITKHSIRVFFFIVFYVVHVCLCLSISLGTILQTQYLSLYNFSSMISVQIYLFSQFSNFDTKSNSQFAFLN